MGLITISDRDEQRVFRETVRSCVRHSMTDRIKHGWPPVLWKSSS